MVQALGMWWEVQVEWTQIDEMGGAVEDAGCEIELEMPVAD